MTSCLDLETTSVMQAGPLEPLCVAPETPVREVLERLKREGRAEVLICRDGVLVGIFTERDALAMFARGDDLNAEIGRWMTSDVKTVRESDTLRTAVIRMATNGYRRLPIIDEARHPKGVVEVEGVVHWLVGNFPEAVYNLPPDTNPATKSREGP